MKLLCDVEKCNPEIKAALLKMLQKLLGSFSIIGQQRSFSLPMFWEYRSGGGTACSGASSSRMVGTVG